MGNQAVQRSRDGGHPDSSLHFRNDPLPVACHAWQPLNWTEEIYTIIRFRNRPHHAAQAAQLHTSQVSSLNVPLKRTAVLMLADMNPYEPPTTTTRSVSSDISLWHYLAPAVLFVSHVLCMTFVLSSPSFVPMVVNACVLFGGMWLWGKYIHHKTVHIPAFENLPSNLQRRIHFCSLVYTILLSAVGVAGIAYAFFGNAKLQVAWGALGLAAVGGNPGTSWLAYAVYVKSIARQWTTNDPMNPSDGSGAS